MPAALPIRPSGARATPIYLTSAFVFKDSDHVAALVNLERAGHVYSCISNPTNAVLEKHIAALEGGVAGIAVASGQAADAPWAGNHRRCRLEYRGIARVVWRLAQPAVLHVEALPH